MNATIRSLFDQFRRVRIELWICLFLSLLTLAAYRQVGTFDFVNYDDSGYVYENPRVIQGLTLDNMVWAFTTSYESNWHPVTWISHMIGAYLYGLDPGRHHATNLFIHICNTLLLFFTLKNLSGALWRSALVAALFSVHPLQVESVAWISERKNLLCGFFWMLTLLGYIRYIEKPCLFRYLTMTVLFALGAMAKPMIVTLPFVMLLLDYWPLSRFQNNRGSPIKTALDLIAEKAPLLILSMVSCGITLMVQQKGGSVTSFEAYPLWARASNALVSYALYIKNALWPFKLAVFYPLPEAISVWHILGAACFLSTISFWVLKNARRKPYLFVGWLWYVGILIPVIGLVQVGSQAMADRYAYIPIIGLFIGIVWTAAGFVRNRKLKPKCPAVAAAAVLILFSITTWIQAGYWKDSASLFSQAVAVTSRNYVAHNNLGLVLEAQGKSDEAVAHFKKALQIHPEYEPAHINLGNALAFRGRVEEAIRHYSTAVLLKPRNPMAYKNYGLAMVRLGKLPDAISLFRKALQINPNYPDAHNDIGVALAVQGKIDEAISHFKEALRLAPGHKKAANALRLAMTAKDNFEF